MTASNKSAASGEQTTTLDAAQIAAWLETHPEFFTNQQELLGKLHIPHPATGEAISLIEKQVDILRSQNRQLERRMVDLIEVARLNEAAVEKIHHFSLSLLDAHDLNDVLTTVEDNLRNRFAAEQVAICLFRGKGLDFENTPARRVTRDDLANEFGRFLETGKPQCGRLRPAQLDYLFADNAANIGSAALIPLGATLDIGLIAIGSKSEDQFSPTLGTVYLSRIGELVAAALREQLGNG